MSGDGAIIFEEVKTQAGSAPERAAGAEETAVTAHLTSVQVRGKVKLRIQAHNEKRN